MDNIETTGWVIDLGATAAYLQRNWLAGIPWLIAVGLLLYAYFVSRKQKNVVTSKTTAGEKRDLFKYLRLKFWYKPRGFVMGRRASREREIAEKQLMALHMMLAVEQLYVQGLIHPLSRKWAVDRVACMTSDPTFWDKGHLKIVKARVKKELAELKKMRPLPFPDMSAEKGEGEPQKSKPLLSKVA